MDIAHTAATVIARARDAYDGSAAEFDQMISTHGMGNYGELYNETYALANEGHPVSPGDGPEALAARKERAAALYEQLMPELEAYEAACRSAKFTGWSKESGGPVRRVR